jgi:ribokinase
MDVLCIGNLNYDISFHLSQIPAMHEKVRCEDTTFSCGGSAGNTACWLGSLGMSCGMVGAVGEDAFGQAQIDDLHAYHVDTSRVQMIGKSGIAVIMVEGEAKRMIKYSGANKYKDVHNLPECTHIHLSSNEESILETMVSHRSSTPTLSWDPQELLFEEYIPYFDYLFINEDDLYRQTEISSPLEAARSLHGNTIVVTKNGGGCLIVTDTTMNIPSFGIEALDSTGAGDAFDAGFLYGVLSGLHMEFCGIIGTACASLKVQHHGARGGICSTDELSEFLLQQGKSIPI